MSLMLLFNPITLLLVYILYTKTPQTSLAYYPVMLVGVVIDAAVNITWFTVLFWDLPQEPLLTKRVKRLKSSSGYRGWLANAICKLLNHFEKDHC